MRENIPFYPERRRFPRIPFWYIVRYKPFQPGKEYLFRPRSSRAKDISLGGILIETPRFYEPLTMLEVEIDVPQEASRHIYVKAIGRVLRSIVLEPDRAYDTVVEFTVLPPDYKNEILRLINAFS